MSTTRQESRCPRDGGGNGSRTKTAHRHHCFLGGSQPCRQLTQVLLGKNRGPPITTSERGQAGCVAGCMVDPLHAARICMRPPLLQRLQNSWRPISASSGQCPIRWLKITEKPTEARSRDARKARCSRKWCCVDKKLRASRLYHGSRIKLEKPQGTCSEDRANSRWTLSFSYR